MLANVTIRPTIPKLWNKLFRSKNTPPPHDEALYRLIEETKRDMEQCRQNLAFADNDALIDMYIYAIKANELRYSHLLRMAKDGAVAQNAQTA